ncbi:MAG: tyrosine-type recombinase/integrase [Verrucomicrobiota bacterium]
MARKHRTGYLFKRGGNFYVQWRVNGKAFSRVLIDENGKAITDRRKAEQAKVKVMAPFTTADEAAALESIAAKIEGRKAELARLEDEQNPPLAIATAWAEFLASPSRPDTGPETLTIYEYQFAKWAEWMKEKHPEAPALRSITKEVAEEYASALNYGTLTANTYNKHLNVLAMVFRVLKNKAKLTGNPWEDIPRKRSIPQSRRELTVDELKTICQRASGELRTLLGLGVYTGLRQKDCCLLRWSEVDLTRGIIRRVPSKVARRNPKPVLIPIHPVLREMLNETPADQRGEYVLAKTADDYQNHRRELVKSIQDHFTWCGIRVHKPVGAEGKRPVVEVGFHSLRHTFVSLCRESNAPLAVVESIVGHSNPAMTRHYTHVGELAAGLAVAALPSLIGDATSKQPKHDPDALLREVKATVEAMTGKNWRENKAAVLAMMAGVENGQAAVDTSH